MDAVILAAGQGTRLRPLTYAIPKPLLPVGGRPVIDYVIDNLAASHDISKIYVAVSHMRETIASYLEHTPRKGVKIETVTTLGWDTGGDLRAVVVEKELKGPVMVAYGDNVTNIDVNALLAMHKRTKARGTVALFGVPPEDVHRFGVAVMKGDWVQSFVEKPAGKPASNLANAGYYVLEHEEIEKIPHKKVKVEDAVFPRLAKEGGLAGYIYSPKYWLDIGTLESYKRANHMMFGILPPD
ncbi:MAG: nucleotidyltransferase family protein [Candidatus Micrarchaeia archaeon]|jgi:mannose-1-phosphate guanylyltransferase